MGSDAPQGDASAEKGGCALLCTWPDVPGLTVWASVAMAIIVSVVAAATAVPEALNSTRASGTTVVIGFQWHLASVAFVLLFASQNRVLPSAQSNRLLPALSAATHEVIVLACFRMAQATVVHMVCYFIYSVGGGSTGVVPYAVRNAVAGVAASCGADVLVRTTLVPFAKAEASQVFPLALQCAVLLLFSIAPTLSMLIDFRVGVVLEGAGLSLILPVFFCVLWVAGGCPRRAPLPPMACSRAVLYRPGRTAALAKVMNDKQRGLTRSTFRSIVLPMTILSALTAVLHLGAGIGHGVCVWNGASTELLGGGAPITDSAVQRLSVSCSRLGSDSVDWHNNATLVHENNQIVRILACVLAWMWLSHALQSSVLQEQSEVSTAMLRWLSHECRSPVSVALLTVENIAGEDLVDLEQGLGAVTAACQAQDPVRVKQLITKTVEGVQETRSNFKQLEAPLHMLVGVLDNMLTFLKHRREPSTTLAAATRPLDVGAALFQASRMIKDVGPTLGHAAPHISFSLSAPQPLLGGERAGPHAFGMSPPLPRLELACSSTANTFTLQQVLLNLLSNAVKYGASSAAAVCNISVQVSLRAVPDAAHTPADNQSPPIAPHRRSPSALGRLSLSGMQGPVPGSVVVPMAPPPGRWGAASPLSAAPIESGQGKVPPGAAAGGAGPAPQRAELCISVADQGRGMTAQEMESLFTPFARLKAGRLQQGTGLGLWLMRELLQSQGGDLTVASAGLGCGSTFTAIVPVQLETGTVPATITRLEAALAAPPALMPAAGAGKGQGGPTTKGSTAEGGDQGGPMPRILLVDDSKPLRNQLARGLRRLGCQVVPCPEGATALQTWRSSPFRHFDVVVCDMSMPVMDGPTLARALGAEDAFDAPFLGLTGQALEEDTQMFIAAGADAVLTKPASAVMVLDNIQRLMASRREAQGFPEMRETKSL